MWQIFTQLFSIAPELLWKFVIAMLAATAISLGIGWVYKFTHRGLSYEATFLPTLVSMAPIVCCVMFFIQGNLSLSLGLVGSLAIIRFRTPIKDSRDMVFLFWSIATGLGAGTDNLGLVLAAGVLVALLYIIMHYVRYGVPADAEYVLIIRGEEGFSADQINRVISSLGIEAYLRSHEVKSDYWERVLELKLLKVNQDLMDQLVGSISKLDQVSEVSLLAPQLALPL